MPALPSRSSPTASCRDIARTLRDRFDRGFGTPSPLCLAGGNRLTHRGNIREAVLGLVSNDVGGVEALHHVLNRGVDDGSHEDNATIRTGQVLLRAVRDGSLALGEHRGPGDRVRVLD